MTSARRARARTRLDPARQAAYAALRAVDVDDAYLNLTLPTLLSGSELTGRDAAFTTELANGTVRMQGLYDVILARCLSGGDGVASLQPEVLTALRLGTHQILGMRVPSHAAVGTSVELVRAAVGERPVRLVNAVLRRVAATPLDQWLDEVAPAGHTGDLASLALRHSHPRWVVDAFAKALAAAGIADAELPLLLAADNRAPLVTLAVRPGLATFAQLAEYGVEPGRFSPYAGVLPGGDPRDLAELRAGTVGVQDEGSQLAALLTARAEVAGRDGRWLDLCAGPGGKAALLTGLARQRGATLVASELLPHRAALVSRALRAYRQPVALLAADATSPAWSAGAFDRVLVDAPCTGLGALRRRPEARWRRTPDDLRALVPRQRRLLESALEAVRPGGTVAYVTCSPHLEETRGVVDAVLAALPDVHEEDATAVLPDVPDTGPGPHVQLWPHRHGTDAMFMALLRRGERG
ncbi:MAG: rRNA (cytosine967-C5)-methyltransferase [Nocardioidaceae bacterium]|jgi:16S rRNA (cytosine967-C5)-methyltransferase|nr:rRNA (cytosine967-C5)-methyltransferase [Nocardioidaceae bacterium]